MSEITEQVKRWLDLANAIGKTRLEYRKEATESFKKDPPHLYVPPGGSPARVYHERLHHNLSILDAAIEKSPLWVSFADLTHKLAIACERAGFNSAPLHRLAIQQFGDGGQPDAEVKHLLAKLEAAATEATADQPEVEKPVETRPMDVYISMVERDPAKHLWTSTRSAQVLGTSESTIRSWKAWTTRKWQRDTAQRGKMEQDAQERMERATREFKPRD